MFKIYLAVCSILIFSSGCLTQTDDLAFQAKGPYAELLRNVYSKSVEWHSLLENKFFEIHSNLSRVVIDVNAKSVSFLIKGIEKLETLRGQVKSFLNSHRRENIDCVSKVDMKVEKVLYKIGNKISDCAVLADQQIQGVTNKKIDLGSDILEIAELSLSETLDVVTEHFSSGRSIDELKDIKQEYEEAFVEVDEEIRSEIIPAINEEMNDIRDVALRIPSTIEMCISNVLMKLNNVVAETGKFVDKCGAA